MEIANKAAFVTGGSGDIGAAICKSLAAAGCDVIVGYTGNRESAETTAVAEGARQRAILKRASSAEDIAQQTVMFCRADSITGQTLIVDGGIFFH